MNKSSEQPNERNIIKDYITEKGFFIPENFFISKEDFLSNDFNSLIENMIQTIFVSNQKYNFAIIQSSFLTRDNEYSIKLIEAIGTYDYLSTLLSPDYSLHYVIKKEEEDFIKSNIKEFDLIILDLISKIHHSDFDIEYEESKKAIDEEIKEQERINQKVLLPLITKCNISDITSDSAVISINEITLQSILQKNRSIERGFQLKYNNATITYRLYLYNATIPEYVIISPITMGNESKDDIKHKGKILFHLNELQSNHCYLFKLSLVFNNEFISLPKKTFYFHTKALSNKAYCLYGFGSNEHSELILSTPSKITQLTSLHNSINDFSFMQNQTLLSLSSGEVVNAGKFWLNKGNEDLLFETEHMSNPDIEMNYSTQPFIIHFPIQVYIRKVEVGYEHCLALSNLGECYSWGANTFGQLGLGIEKTLVVGKPQKIVLIHEKESVYITDIQAGFNHNIALGFVGTKSLPFSWGYNQGGEPSALNKVLGQEIYCSSVPKLLNFFQSESIVKIYAKYNTSAIIVKSSTVGINHVYTFGLNLYDQLGFHNALSNDQRNWDIPTLVNHFSDNAISVLNVSFCERYAAFLTKTKTLQDNSSEVYLTGTCDFIKKTPMKIPELLQIHSRSEYGDIECVCSTLKALYIVFKDKKIMTINNSSSSPKEMINMGDNDLSNGNVVKMEGMNDNFLMMIKQN